MADETILFYCSDCKSKVQLITRGEAWVHQPELYKDSSLLRRIMMIGTTYWFGQCANCRSVIGLVSQERFGPDPGQRGPFKQIHPPLRQVNYQLPPLVDHSYREAIKCEATGAWQATTVMVRRALEAIAKEFDPSAKSLQQGLESMKSQGAISEELLQWAHGLRLLGNVGAHATEEQMTDLDAREAIDFLDAIAEIIYQLRPKFKAMQARRGLLDPSLKPKPVNLKPKPAAKQRQL